MSEEQEFWTSFVGGTWVQIYAHPTKYHAQAPSFLFTKTLIKNSNSFLKQRIFILSRCFRNQMQKTFFLPNYDISMKLTLSNFFPSLISNQGSLRP